MPYYNHFWNFFDNIENYATAVSVKNRVDLVVGNMEMNFVQCRESFVHMSSIPCSSFWESTYASDCINKDRLLL